VRASRLNVVLSLLGADDGLDGTTITERLHAGGSQTTPGKLLVHLLALEESGHVHVERHDGYRFSLTPDGEAIAYDLGPGGPVAVTLVMADLVGFVSFTAAQGDGAAHRVAKGLRAIADEELTDAGGRVVKSLGDGFLGVVDREHDGVAVTRRIADRCRDLDSTSWSVRAAVHDGQPIQHQGDLYGADVNLVARLCEAASPDEVITTTAGADREVELIDLRGLDEPIAVARMALR
jgi:class 3 adenylate cyclase